MPALHAEAFRRRTMFGKNHDMAVNPGDRFAMKGKIDTVWVVKKMLEMNDMPPHLHITPENKNDGRVLTYAVSAVLDQKLFSRLDS